MPEEKKLGASEELPPGHKVIAGDVVDGVHVRSHVLHDLTVNEINKTKHKSISKHFRSLSTHERKTL